LLSSGSALHHRACSRACATSARRAPLSAALSSACLVYRMRRARRTLGRLEAPRPAPPREPRHTLTLSQVVMPVTLFENMVLWSAFPGSTSGIVIVCAGGRLLMTRHRERAEARGEKVLAQGVQGGCLGQDGTSLGVDLGT
jgi:hypothetical protein